MIRTTFFALIGMLATVSAQAAITITSAGAPTTGMAGFTTYTLTAASDSAPIAGFDFFGTEQDPLGFFGAMGQVSQPPTLTQTVFNDSNGFFPLLGRDVSQDSQFMFNATGANSVLVPTGFSNEGPDFLRASFALPAPVQSVAFAQIVVADAASATVEFEGLIGFPTASGLPLERVMGCVGPEAQCGTPPDNLPPVISALAPINVAWPNVVTDLQLTATDDLTPVGQLVWSALTPGGSNPTALNAPTLGANGLFNWDPTGSQGGTYTWTATVADTGNPALTDTDLALTINYTVPEPATLSLLGLALVGFVGLARKRS